jgi:phosphoribosyl 1,2-cyclic phosphodiesterase
MADCGFRRDFRYPPGDKDVVMQMCVLASGSAANCTVVRSAGGTILIDAGLGPRATALRMAEAAVSVSDVAAICLTHLDRDHFNLNWVRLIVKRGITVHCHRSRLDDLCRLADCAQFSNWVRPFGIAPFQPVPGITLLPIPLAHDAEGSHGFVVESSGESTGTRLGFATDLGHVPGAMIDAFQRLDFLAIESNYDPDMQRSSSRPFFLQRRIMGGHGHLSNEQAYDAVREILNRSHRSGHALPQHIVLLHRSQECNCPQVVRGLFARDPRIAQRLTLADQHAPTAWLRTQPRFVGDQMMLSWSV